MSATPVVFVSHGSPMFALEPGLAGLALTTLGRDVPRPQAVLVVSPHWMTRGAKVQTGSAPGALHDFGGFPPALYQLRYPSPGHPVLARRTIEILNQAGWAAEEDPDRGFDHGAWVPMTYLYPRADVPMFQVSLPAHLDAARAYALGQALRPLAGDGVLIVGSGSLTHNLREVKPDHGHPAAYAQAFSDWIAQTLAEGDHEQLQQVMALAPHAERAHPTTEHLWPLLVAAGAAGKTRSATRLEGGITHGVLSMDAYRFD